MQDLQLRKLLLEVQQQLNGGPLGQHDLRAVTRLLEAITHGLEDIYRERDVLRARLVRRCSTHSSRPRDQSSVQSLSDGDDGTSSRDSRPPRTARNRDPRSWSCGVLTNPCEAAG